MGFKETVHLIAGTEAKNTAALRGGKLSRTESFKNQRLEGGAGERVRVPPQILNQFFRKIPCDLNRILAFIICARGVGVQLEWNRY